MAVTGKRVETGREQNYEAPSKSNTSLFLTTKVVVYAAYLCCISFIVVFLLSLLFQIKNILNFQVQMFVSMEISSLVHMDIAS